MNFRIERQADRAIGLRWWDFVLPILHQRFGKLTLTLLFILFVAESIYRHWLHQGGVFAVGGTGTQFGLGLLAVAIFDLTMSVRRHKKLSLQFADRRHYLTLTNDYVETEVPGLWQYRIGWPMLTGFKEDASGFFLHMGDELVRIRRGELKDEAKIAELRAFLAARTPPKPPTPGEAERKLAETARQ